MLRSGASVCNPRAGPLRTDFAKDAEKTPPSTQARAASTALGGSWTPVEIKGVGGFSFHYKSSSETRAHESPSLYSAPLSSSIIFGTHDLPHQIKCGVRAISYGIPLSTLCPDTRYPRRRFGAGAFLLCLSHAKEDAQAGSYTHRP